MKHILLTIAAVVLVGCGESQPPEPPTGKTPDISIHDAAEEGNVEVVKQHLAAGTDVNAKNNAGTTPLHWSARHNDHKEIVELLIAEGADVNAKNVSGRTPLDSAEERDAQILRVFGFEKRSEDKVKAAKKEIADLLRKHGGKTGEELK